MEVMQQFHLFNIGPIQHLILLVYRCTRAQKPRRDYIIDASICYSSPDTYIVAHLGVVVDFKQCALT